jgi:hypothetical protein
MMHPWPVPGPRRLAVTTIALVIAGVAAAGCGADAVVPEMVTESIAVPWRAEPIVIAEGVAARAEGVCRDLQVRVGPQPVLAPLAVADVRGGSKVFFVYADATSEAECMAELAPNGDWTTGIGGSGSGDAFEALAPGALSIFGGMKAGEGVDAVSSVTGRVGPGVAGVEIATGSGQRIHPSIGPTGWYAAWWPSDDPYGLVTAYDAAGNPTGTAQ